MSVLIIIIYFLCEALCDLSLLFKGAKYSK